jgi:hypothetical protein
MHSEFDLKLDKMTIESSRILVIELLEFMCTELDHFCRVTQNNKVLLQHCRRAACTNRALVSKL